ncbi:hypothetical protein THTE_1859 [Thermogutta terrifontis]|uniref:Uncharacterized protein n=1 Tax=Thermogutta terrifontis TaxID=1331910 RepID=A0A286RET3_9BACT|nr:hypothetical protein THTE_1859 [Thermogutta terrifontis]
MLINEGLKYFELAPHLEMAGCEILSIVVKFGHQCVNKDAKSYVVAD